jgi:hypothetical protein
MSAEELLKMTEKVSSAVTDTHAIRDKIFEEFDAAANSDQRSALLAIFKATMDVAESYLAKKGDKQELAKFRESRAEDYTRLLVKESTVDGTLEGAVSPELFMAVTNREIAAGRMTADDPIRRSVVAAAGAQHPSYAELLEHPEGKKRADLLIDRVVHDLRTPGGFDLSKVRKSIGKAFDAAATSEQRGKVLALFKMTMDQVERKLSGPGDEAQLLADIQKARAQDYKIFIVQECTVGLDTPVVGGDISVDMLMDVTNREIAAGRMTEDHSLRKIAVEGAAAPHLSHAELMAKHATLKEEAGASKAEASAPKASSGTIAYAVGKTLGKRLKGLFGK